MSIPVANLSIALPIGDPEAIPSDQRTGARLQRVRAPRRRLRSSPKSVMRQWVTARAGGHYPPAGCGLCSRGRGQGTCRPVPLSCLHCLPRSTPPWLLRSCSPSLARIPRLLPPQRCPPSRLRHLHRLPHRPQKTSRYRNRREQCVGSLPKREEPSHRNWPPPPRATCCYPDKEGIQRVIHANFPKLKHCYETAMTKSRPDLKGEGSGEVHGRARTAPCLSLATPAPRSPNPEMVDCVVACLPRAPVP